jgi:hypothetical protein
MIKTSPLLPLHVVAYHPRSYIVELGDVYVEDWMQYEEWAMREEMYPTGHNARHVGQTTFELPYAAEHMQVHINGMMQPSDTYSVSGNTITFAEPPTIGDIVIITPFDGSFIHRFSF